MAKIELSVGDRVVVVKDHYSGRTVGMTGTVRDNYANTRISVRIDAMPNPRSKYDCYYYTAKQLKLIEGDSLMKTKDKNKNIKTGNFKVAYIKFLEGSNISQTYKYALYPDTDATINDICVVKSASHGLGIARIVEIHEHNGEEITREIVGKVDCSAYEARVAQRLRLEKLEEEMRKRAAEVQELLIYKTLAANDEAMAELLKEYEGLIGGSTDGKC